MKYYSITLLIFLMLQGCDSFPPDKNRKMSEANNNDTDTILSVDDARDALINMMQNTDRLKWGGRIKSPTLEEIFEFESNEINSNALSVRYHETPPEVPKIMYETEEMKDGLVRIGFWMCDLKEHSFYTIEENEYFYNRLDGAFSLDASGKWTAEYWGGDHGSKMQPISK